MPARAPLNVLVTGSSSGFGGLIVKTLAGDGHRVFASMRDIGSRNAVAAERLAAWSTAHGATIEVLELDVASDASVKGAVDRVLAVHGSIDVVVNNAGTSAVGPLEAFSMDQIEGLFNVNAFGPLRVSNAVLPSMRARGHGLIVCVSSTLGRILPLRGGLYPATKWALEGLAESLHYQVAAFGIDVAIVEPGSYPTPATSKSIPARHQDIAAAYAARSQPRARPRADAAYVAPDPQEVAEAVRALIERPAGTRPLRTVVGPVFTEGVSEFNEVYERTKQHLATVLARPDQALPWAMPASEPPDQIGASCSTAPTAS
jgi:NAD(P)-dependent dehydrogenase (short-subunit alcohol dehydrogenase family)